MKKIKTMVMGFVATAMALAFSATASAQSALPAEVTGAFTEIATTAGLVFAAAAALWATLRGFSAILRLGNKYIGKAGG